MSAPVAVCIVGGPDYVVELANKDMLLFLGRTSSIVGKPIIDALPEAGLQGLIGILDEVRNTGQPYHVGNFPAVILIDGVRELRYFDLVFKPHFLSPEDVVPASIFCVAHNVTVQFHYQKNIEESEHRFRTFIEEAAVATGLYLGRELQIQHANDIMLSYWGKDNTIIGMPIGEALPELKGQPFLGLIDEVYLTGIPYTGIEEEAFLRVDGRLQPFYFNFTYKALRNKEGNIYGIHHTAIDVTKEVRSRKKVEESEQDLRNMVLQAPIGVCVIDATSLIAQIANDRFIEISGKTMDEIVGKFFWDAFAEARIHYEDALNKVINEGVTYRADDAELMLIRHGKEEMVYISFAYEPMKNNQGIVKKVAVWVLDNTAKVMARRKVEESENNFRNMILQSPVAMGILKGPEFVVEIANERMFELWGRSKEELLHKSIFRGLPEATNQGYEELLRGVFTTGKTFSALGIPVNLPRSERVETVYINVLYEAFAESEGNISGVMVAATDVTEQVVSKMKVEESNQEFKFVTDFMPQIIWATKADGYHDFYNKQWYDYTGLTDEQSKDGGWNTAVHPDDQERAWDVWLHSLKTGSPYEIEYRFKRFDGQYRWFLGRALPLKDEAGAILKWYGTCTDIDDQKKGSELLEEKVKERTIELEDQKNLLDNILKNSSNGISVTEMIRNERGEIYDANTILANASAVKYVGLPEDIYLSKTAVELDPNILNSSYGQTCLKTLATGEPSLIQYYMEVTDRWLELTLSKMDNDHLIHIFTDVTSVKESQLQLERTMNELKRSNANLEEFAYAASHDLKEPIRKIRTFSERLKKNLQGRLLDDDQHYFERMEKATERMKNLIDDLLEYSHVSTSINYLDEVDLNKKVTQVLEDLELEVAEKKARVMVGALPVIKGHKRQMQQLFQNLITNALKFSKRNVSPQISIYSAVVSGENINSSDRLEESKNKLYNLIEISDNGIGFEQEYADKIFKMFQRLHGKTEYEGTGIGLAIVRKVVENHKGFIEAVSQPGKGATFKVFLPIE
ncbi:PAS domain-containing protein [Segetibacter koreensis]|uniref:PAS domain-containing protein n=1 Tax=Segetibacter koreensis TaxID=398037 RepID=UPI00036AC3E6|nr:PAS domain-containing protein [Segetibacter koreensis]